MNLDKYAMQDLIQTLRRVLETLPGIKMAILYGSCAIGKAAFDSDVDLAVLGERKLSVIQKTDLISKLALETGRAIDLIDLKTVGEPLLGEILAGKRLLGENEVFAALLSRHLIDAADFLPLQQRILKERRKAWLG